MPTHQPHYQQKYDLKNCDKEPIHKILRSQSYGFLILSDILFDEWHYCSDNLIEKVRKSSVSDILKDEFDISVASLSDSSDTISTIQSTNYLAIFHKKDFGWIIEIEPAPNKNQIKFGESDYQSSILALSITHKEQDFYKSIVDEIYRIIGYDHIMVYRFDEEANGEIIEERKIEERPSYLHMKFPATDIPPQARKLFFSDQVRIIYDTDEECVLVKNNDTQLDLDLTKVAMRGVSPIHIEYLQNMGVRSSFSVAIIHEDRLWGLIACHHMTPRLIHFKVREWLKFFSNLISINLTKIKNYQSSVEKVEDELLRYMLVGEINSTKELVDVLTNPTNNILNVIDAQTGIVFTPSEIRSIGNIPSSYPFKELYELIIKKDIKEHFATNNISEVIPENLKFDNIAGMLVVRISPVADDYIVWFREERVQEIKWAGNPYAYKSFDESKNRLTPRKSFEEFNETVNDTSEPWNDLDINKADALRNALRNKLYERFNQVVLLYKELKETYAQMSSLSYSVSHDLKAPLRSIEGFARMLKEDYSQVLDNHGLHLLDVIMNGVVKMRDYIHAILDYNKTYKGELNIEKVDALSIINAEWEMLKISYPEASLEIDDDLPHLFVDKSMFRQICQNLLSNSLKYANKDVPCKVRISHKLDDIYVKLYFEDNGPGIPYKYRNKVFQEFKRLVGEEIEGSGLGLSIVKRIVLRHGGEIRISEAEHFDSGSLFELSLPIDEKIIEILESRKNLI